jgi:hypothetical protein
MISVSTFLLEAAAAFVGCFAARAVDSYLIDGSGARSDAVCRLDEERFNELEEKTFKK